MNFFIGKSGKYLLAVCLLFLAAAAGFAQEEVRKPVIPAVKMVEKSEKVGVTRIIFKIPVGKKVVKVINLYGKEEEFDWKKATVEGEKQYPEIVAKLLRNYGYDVIEDSDDLFGTGGSAKARFQIAGVVTDMYISRVFSGYVGCCGGLFNSINAVTSMYMDIEWQIYDSINDKIVLKKTTTGLYYDDKKIEDGEALFYGTFENAFLQFMAMDEFVKVLGGK
ncbi:MAG: hypothetical protein JW904_05470 [Spirochaetales bacterium]|nr:hypothetical protein [Spirochaetales bacterium]